MTDRNIMIDGMMGLVVGDALGCPVQFLSREQIKKRGLVTGMEGYGTYNMPVGTWTDDSSMVLCELASINEKKGIDLDDIMKRFMDWEFNGALMRILPVCLYYLNRQNMICTSDDEAIHNIHEVTALTHNHLRSHIASGLYYFVAKAIVHNPEKINLTACIQRGLDDGFRFYGKDLRNLTEITHYGRLFSVKDFALVEEDAIRGSGYVVESLEAALWCLVTTDSFKDCLLKAVNLGDDTDTVAAIAGGLAGLYYGYHAIPAEWLEVLQKRDWLEEMCK